MLQSLLRTVSRRGNIPSLGGFWVLGFWGFGVLGFWGFGVLGFWGFGVLGFWGFGVLGFWGFGVCGFKGFGFRVGFGASGFGPTLNQPAQVHEP